MNKQCNRCFETRDISEFSMYPAKTDNHMYICKTCKIRKARNPKNIMEKQCRRCLEVKSIDNFYVHPNMEDGHLNICKACKTKDQKDLYYKDVEASRLKERIRGRTEHKKAILKKSHSKPEMREKLIINKKRWADANKDKRKAQWKAIHSVKSGKIERKELCEDCGDKAFAMHHEDYSKPLDVVWLCTGCHGKRHRKYA